MTQAKLTQERKLLTGKPLWSISPGINTPACELRNDVFADVAIVGAGISGALMAVALIKHGLRVVILDRRLPGKGSTLGSTALLQYELDVPLFRLADEIGWNPASRIWHRSLRGVRSLKQLIRHERVRCALADARSLYLTGSDYGSQALSQEVRARHLAGLPSELLSGAQLRTQYGMHRTAAIVSNDMGSANPAQLTAGLLRRCVARGARIFCPADVQELSADSSGVVLGIVNGPTINCDYAVFCTGYELPKIVQTGPGDTINSTWALATDPVKNAPTWLRHALIWEASSPYLYMRSTRDGRIVAGGEDERSSVRHENSRLLRPKTDKIAKNVQKLLPGIQFRIRYRWAGAFGEASDGCPIIGPIGAFPRCYSLTGFGGNGITFSMMASEIISSYIVGLPDPDASLFLAAGHRE